MCKRDSIFLTLVVVFVSFFMAPTATAQVSELMQKGDSLHRAYRFQDAAKHYERALVEVFDTSYAHLYDTTYIDNIRRSIILAENGRNMAEFVRKPKVLAKERFSIDDYYLYLPLENESWRKIPNPLDSSLVNEYVNALYAPDWNDVLYYSAEGEDGFRNIYTTELRDTLWSVPVEVELSLPEGTDEIFPIVSPDGKYLYFSSKGLYGIGGYDLYVSEWDDRSRAWSTPKNMGFPFSSPADDFLFMDTDDGRYSLFASNRDCPVDSVDVYVIEYEAFPIHASLSDPDELLELSRLKIEIQDEVEDQTTEAVPEHHLRSSYMSKMLEVRAITDSISTTMSLLDEMRMEYAFSDDNEERFSLTEKILNLENNLPPLRKKLDQSKSELREIEIKFLNEGIYIDMDISEQKPSAQDNSAFKYYFYKNSMGPELVMEIEKPVVLFDYSFKVLEEAQFAEDQSIPEGIIYQIQMFSGGRKATLKELKGLSPIYEHRSPSGLYIYRVGLFDSYEEVLNCVNTVRRRGFSSAYIAAFIDGVEVSVSKARSEEAKKKNEPLMYEVRIIPDTGELDNELVKQIVQMAIGKDIVRYEAEDGTQVFTIRPFDDKEQADSLAEYIKDYNIGKVIVEILGQELVL